MAESKEKRFNKKILIAVDESDNSRRAVEYVGYMLGGIGEFQITLLHVISDPEEDFFTDLRQKEEWLSKNREKMHAVLESYRRLLVSAGVDADSVAIKAPLRYCPSMAECILSERKKDRYATIVVGRQGLSRKEAFLFGSISNKIVNHARDCTVWVVE